MNKKYMSKIRWIIDDTRENKGISISFILAIFPLAFITDSYLFAVGNMEQNKGTENIKNIYLYVLFFLIVGLMFVLSYILISTTKLKAPRYSLLFILGIKKKDFWKILYKDYFMTLLQTGIKSAAVIHFLSICMTDFIWNRNEPFLLIDFLLYYFMGIGIVCVMLVFLIFTVIAIAFYYSLGKEMIVFWEGLNRDIVFKYDNKFLYYLKPILGAFVEMLVIVFCLDYRTIYYAAVLQIVSFYLMSTSVGCLRWIAEYKRKKDYRSIISSYAVMYQYKFNSKLIIVIYLLNFIVAFVVGGFILSGLSDKSQKDYQEKYPFEYIVYGKNINFTQKFYPFFEGETEEGKEVAIFSLSSYENITKRKETLSEYEIIYISQHSPEDFRPLEGKQDLKVFFDSKEINYIIKDSRWETIFGENISPELEYILIVNDNEFEINASNKINLWFGNKIDFVIEKGNHVWNRTEAIEQEKESNRHVMILVYVTGLFLLLESQGIILIKLIVNHSAITKKYKLIYTLGVSRKNKKKYFFEEIRKMAFYPAVSGLIRGILLLGIIYFYQEGLSICAFANCLALCGIILLIQYGSYYCIALLMQRLYKCDLGMG